MPETTAFNNRTESSSSPGSSPTAGLGRVRWTVCAMLFVATSINYMDRQVIAILKPTLEHSIGMTEVGYGYIVDAFQVAYAIGLLAAGRLIDKLGTRIGYMLVMAIWSVSAMGHALASTVLQFGVARFFLGLGLDEIQELSSPVVLRQIQEQGSCSGTSHGFRAGWRRKLLKRKWRKRVGVEPTGDRIACRPPVLKTGTITGPHALPQ
jgi:sugar phosphate permease